ncbi:MAG: FHA domain-containing protein [Micavibrio sp.]|nr:FHA domain-containing protein [Micavibrio sp.]
MKKLILEITSHSGDGTVTHRSIETFPATIGRGYHNDVILGDPHISPQHLRIDYNGSDFIIAELGSENGLTLNDKHFKATETHLKSGDAVRIGRTEIRVFDPFHPVAATQALAKQDPVVAWLSRSVNIWLSFTVAIGSYLGWTYLEVWDEELSNSLVRAGIMSALGILIWALIWGVAGKLVRHKSRYRSHVALASLAVTAFVAAGMLEYYVDFLSNENTVADVFAGGINLFIIGALLYYALTLATDLSQRKKRMWAGFFAGGLLMAFVGMATLNKDKFQQAPDYAARLEPYFASLAPAESLDTFMAGNAQTFDEDLFTAPKTENK